MTMIGSLFRYGFDFANRFRWRVGIAVCFMLVVAAGNYAFRAQHRMTEIMTASRDGERILVTDRGLFRKDLGRIIDGDGKTICILDESISSRSPLISASGDLFWLETMSNGKKAIRRLSLTAGNNQKAVTAVLIDERFRGFLVDDAGRLIYSVQVDEKGKRYLVIRTEDDRELARMETGRGETCRCVIGRNRDGNVQMYTSVIRDSAQSSDDLLLTKGWDSSQFVFDPSTETFSKLDGEENKWKTGSESHRVIRRRSTNGWSYTVSIRKRSSLVNRILGGVNPASVLFKTPQIPKWIENDTFYCWDDDRTTLSIYGSGEPVRTIPCAACLSSFPIDQGRLLVSTETGLLHLVDSKSSALRTIRNVRAGWRLSAAIASMGIPICIIAWLWSSWRQEVGSDKLSPLADVLLLLIAVTFAFSGFYQSSNWANHLEPVLGVLTWTLLGTSTLYAANCRSVFGRGLAILLPILAGVLFFLSRNSRATSILINSGGVFVALMVFGGLGIRRKHGRFMLPQEGKAKMAERQISLWQIVVLTCCFSALFSVMSFDGIGFTLNLRWKKLVPAIVLAVTVLVPLIPALRAKSFFTWFGAWLLAATFIPHAYWLAEAFGRLDTWGDLTGLQQPLTTTWSVTRLSPHNFDYWLLSLMHPMILLAVPSLFIVLIVRYCRAAGMRLAK